MANYKVPRAVEFLDEIPLNATGKVMKNVLRERAAAAAVTSPSGAGDDR
jgi:acyl-CoA synthetase (AMP-forming)/AMP-acid ligase II